jgi:hypothetical protein
MEKQRLDKKGTLKVLTWLDERLERDGYQERYKLYCMGGTKMILSDLRQSSEDIDFLVPSHNTFRVLSTYIAQLDWKHKIRFDTFSEGELPGYTYKEFEENARKTPYRFRHLELYFIDDADFIITKALAYRDKDVDDINKIFSKRKIPKEELIKRFGRIRFKPEKEKELRENFKRFLAEFYK